MAERVRLNDRNFSLLKTHALEDYQRRDIDYELEGIASEIERIDQKMNLMTELLCDLLSAEAQNPGAQGAGHLDGRAAIAAGGGGGL